MNDNDNKNNNKLYSINKLYFMQITHLTNQVGFFNLKIALIPKARFNTENLEINSYKIRLEFGLC